MEVPRLVTNMLFALLGRANAGSKRDDFGDWVIQFNLTTLWKCINFIVQRVLIKVKGGDFCILTGFDITLRICIVCLFVSSI